MFIIQYRKFFENLVTTSHHDANSFSKVASRTLKPMEPPSAAPIDKRTDDEWDHSISAYVEHSNIPETPNFVSNNERNLWVLLFYYCWYYELSFSRVVKIRKGEERTEHLDGLKLRVQHVWVAFIFIGVISFVAAAGVFHVWYLVVSTLKFFVLFVLL